MTKSECRISNDGKETMICETSSRLFIVSGCRCCWPAWSASLLSDPHMRSCARMRWVEVEVALSPQKQAMIQYKVHWKVQRGTMGGFYFQGETGRIDWHRPGCGAVTDNGKKYQLDLRNLGNKWDVLLAGGQRFGPGEITFVLTYFTDLAASGHLAKTTSPELGDLVVFNWAPVQWDAPLEHETVLVRWPIKVDKEDLTLADATALGFRTEPFVNERYQLSYLGLKGTSVTMPEEPISPDRYLCVRADKSGIGTKENFRLTYYVPADKYPRPSYRNKRAVVTASRAGEALRPRSSSGPLLRPPFLLEASCGPRASPCSSS